MSEKQRIFIVDDHTLLRAGLRALLSQDPDLEIVGEADNGHDAIRAIGSLAPDLVLMDISMRGMNGIETMWTSSGATRTRAYWCSPFTRPTNTSMQACAPAPTATC